MNQDQSLLLEVDRILEDTSFQRSPILSQLLIYLRDRTVGEHADRITQFDIATEGLNKNDYDETSDSYVRVQVSRLKKALAAYYARSAAEHGGCVYLRPGDYRLRIASPHVAYPEQTPVSKSPDPAVEAILGDNAQVGSVRSVEKRSFLSSLGRQNVFGIGALFAFGAMLLMATFDGEGQSSIGGVTPPEVGFEVEQVGFGTQDADLAFFGAAVEAELRDHIAKSVVMNPLVRDDARNVYTISVRLNIDHTGNWIADIDLLDHEGAPVSQAHRSLPADKHAALNIIRQEIVTIASPSGAVTRELAKQIEGEPKTAFECFVSVEMGRSNGVPIPDLLDDCSERFPDSRYYPYLQSRVVYHEFQKELSTSGKLSRSSEHWRRLGDLLDEHPDNPYLNTIAAKALFGLNECSEAFRYAERAFIRGKTFPALEMSILVDQLGCATSGQQYDLTKSRIVEIVDANPEPHPVLELFAIASLLAVDRTDLIGKLASQPFHSDFGIDSAAHDLRAAISNDRTIDTPALLRTIVWNTEARNRIESRLNKST